MGRAASRARADREVIMRIRPLCAIAAAACLAACAHMEYPAGWSPQTQALSGCLSLGGTYRNVPSAVVPEGAQAVELRQFLLPRHVFAREWQTQQRSDVQFVTIEQSKDFATITEHGDSTTRTSRLRILDNSAYVFVTPPDGVGCTRVLWMRVGKEVGGATPVSLLVENSGWSIFKAEDGSLSVQLVSGTSGFVGPVPVGPKWTWYRYDQVR
jgi:hypothetical protein